MRVDLLISGKKKCRCSENAASSSGFSENRGNFMPKIALTGSIACGKSLFSSLLRSLGVEILDADDVAHELIPPEERARLAKIVFKDSAKRKELEAKLHPLIKKRLDDWQEAELARGKIAIVIIPLLYEVGWESSYDIIAAIVCDRALQIKRMIETRGYSQEQAEARLAAQINAEEKASRADYAIWNNGTKEELEKSASAFLAWLKQRISEIQTNI